MKLILLTAILLSSCSSLRLASSARSEDKFKDIANTIESLDGKEVFNLLELIEGRIMSSHGSYSGIKFKNKRLKLREISHKTNTSKQKIVRMGLGFQNCMIKSKTKKSMTACLNTMIEDGAISAYSDHRITDKENSNQTTTDYLKWICDKKKFTTNMDGNVEHNWLPIEADFLLNTGIADHWITLTKFRLTKLCKGI